ncbi:hypothetical protein BB558_002515 [Smittium angustum]|uniref:Uncharacterized protein n=1 Tax=Smittium angustum TaxID=133377 RepID=A0A2U1J8I3_SMIAN|nr:hypothetical protein BB558_002515 [Smittium angustum]
MEKTEKSTNRRGQLYSALGVQLEDLGRKVGELEERCRVVGEQAVSAEELSMSQVAMLIGAKKATAPGMNKNKQQQPNSSTSFLRLLPQ